MKKCFYYSVSVKYNAGYFTNPNRPLDSVLGYASVNEQTIESIQKTMKNCVVERIKAITFEEFLEI